MNYSAVQIEYMRDSYATSKGIALLAREQLIGRVDPLPSPAYLRKTWREDGIADVNERGPIKKRGKKSIHSSELDLIVERMQMYGTLTRSAEQFGHGGDAVRRRLKKLGILREVLDLERKIPKEV